MNDELINKKTYPYFLKNETAEQLIEIDTPADYDNWLKIKKCVSYVTKIANFMHQVQ